VAERLETPEDLALADRLGFDLFQGYALSRPHVLTTTTLSPSRLRRLELLAVLTSPDADVEQILSIILSDPALSYRVLRASSSAANGVPRHVASVREAVVLLGLARIRQWTMLMVIDDVAQATEEQMTSTMARARLCETVAQRYAVATDAAFTVGLLAGVAELLDLPPADLVAQLPITPDVAGALVHGDGPLGEVLRVVEAYQRGDVQALRGAPMDPADLARAYLDVLRWSVKTISSAKLR
jgi:EAL and modified HD-GYP domain-containing signal transduction protein